LRLVSHRPWGGLVRQVQAVRSLAGRRDDPRSVPPSDTHSRPQSSAGARDLRAVPLADEVHRRPAQDHHPSCERRVQHRAEDRAGAPRRRTRGRDLERNPLARGSRYPDPLSLRRNTREDLRGRADGQRRERQDFLAPGKR
jgi:hypothetical protein